MWRNYQADWRALGRDDPFFAVLTDTRFRRDRMTPESQAAFWATGEAYLERIEDLFQKHLGRELRPGVAIDFGCGVGRILAPLARRSARAIGGDVAPGMLEQARKICGERGLANVEFLLLGDDLAGLPATFEFFHTFAVLQHVPPRRGLILMRALLARLAPGGLAAIHLVYELPRRGHLRAALRGLRARLGPLRGVANWVSGKPWAEPYMQMNAYGLNEVFAALQSSGCHRVFTTFTDHAGARGMMLLLEKEQEVSL